MLIIYKYLSVNICNLSKFMNTNLANIILEPYYQKIGQLLVAQNKNILMSIIKHIHFYIK